MARIFFSSFNIILTPHVSIKTLQICVTPPDEYIFTHLPQKAFSEHVGAITQPRLSQPRLLALN